MKTILVLAAASATFILGGCATTNSYPAEVARFQTMPAPAGQRFVILPTDAGQQGSAEFAHYAAIVRGHLLALGFTEAASPQDASLVACFTYGVDENGPAYIEASSWYPYYRGWGGHPYPGGYAAHSGWDDAEIHHNGRVDLQIHRAGDGATLFEGHARAQPSNLPPTQIVADLINAMFSGFPGNSGETVWINVPEQRAG